MLATMRILSSVSTPAYQILPEMFPLITFQANNLSVKHGNAPISTYAYATYGSCSVRWWETLILAIALVSWLCYCG